MCLAYPSVHPCQPSHRQLKHISDFLVSVLYATLLPQSCKSPVYFCIYDDLILLIPSPCAWITEVDYETAPFGGRWQVFDLTCQLQNLIGPFLSGQHVLTPGEMAINFLMLSDSTGVVRGGNRAR